MWRIHSIRQHEIPEKWFSFDALAFMLAECIALYNVQSVYTQINIFSGNSEEHNQRLALGTLLA